MSISAVDKPSPIEVWLSQPNMTVTCTVVREDESAEHLDVDALTMRGAQREITAYLVGLGYSPVGRWDAPEPGTPEVSRQFKAA